MNKITHLSTFHKPDVAYATVDLVFLGHASTFVTVKEHIQQEFAGMKTRLQRSVDGVVEGDVLVAALALGPVGPSDDVGALDGVIGKVNVKQLGDAVGFFGLEFPPSSTAQRIREGR